MSLLGISLFTLLSFADKNFSAEYEKFWISHQNKGTQNTYRIINNKNYITPQNEANSKLHPQSECRFNIDHLTQEIQNRIIANKYFLRLITNKTDH